MNPLSNRESIHLPCNSIEPSYVLVDIGQVFELEKHHNTRWAMHGLNSPCDAQVVGPDRILVVEYNAQCIGERKHNGDILWQKQLLNAGPLGAQRLRNGRTFLTCQSKLVEDDRDGREVFSINRPKGGFCGRARSQPDSVLRVSDFPGSG